MIEKNIQYIQYAVYQIMKCFLLVMTGSATWMVRKEKDKIKSFIIEDGEMKVKGDDFLIPINVFEKPKQPETEYGKSYTRNYCWVIDGKRIPEQTKSEPNMMKKTNPV